MISIIRDELSEAAKFLFEMLLSEAVFTVEHLANGRVVKSITPVEPFDYTGSQRPYQFTESKIEVDLKTGKVQTESPKVMAEFVQVHQPLESKTVASTSISEYIDNVGKKKRVTSSGRIINESTEDKVARFWEVKNEINYVQSRVVGRIHNGHPIKNDDIREILRLRGFEVPDSSDRRQRTSTRGITSNETVESAIIRLWESLHDIKRLQVKLGKTGGRLVPIEYIKKILSDQGINAIEVPLSLSDKAIDATIGVDDLGLTLDLRIRIIREISDQLPWSQIAQRCGVDRSVVVKLSEKHSEHINRYRSFTSDVYKEKYLDGIRLSIANGTSYYEGIREISVQLQEDGKAKRVG